MRWRCWRPPRRARARWPDRRGGRRRSPARPVLEAPFARAWQIRSWAVSTGLRPQDMVDGGLRRGFDRPASAGHGGRWFAARLRPACLRRAWWTVVCGAASTGSCVRPYCRRHGSAGLHGDARRAGRRGCAGRGGGRGARVRPGLDSRRGLGGPGVLGDLGRGGRGHELGRDRHRHHQRLHAPSGDDSRRRGHLGRGVRAGGPRWGSARAGP